MRKILKHILLFAVLVLCLFGISAVAASAAGYSGVATKTDAHVASITTEDATYYYETLKDALKDARSNGKTEIVILKSTSAVTNENTYSNYDVTIKGASKGIVLTMPKKTFTVGNCNISFENLTLSMTGDSIYTPNSCEVNLSFKNVVIAPTSNYSIEFVSGVKANVTMTGCEIKHSSPSAEAYLIYAPGTTLTYNISRLTTNAAVFYGTAATMVDLTLSNITKVNDFPFIRGTAHQIVSETYANDATAKAMGCLYRIGLVSGGKKGEVYFETYDAALAVANGATIYDVSSDFLLTGDLEQKDSHVSAVKHKNIMYYYESFNDALIDVHTYGASDIIVLKSTDAISSSLEWNACNINIKGVDKSVVLTMPYRVFAISGGGSFSFEDITLALSSDAIYTLEACDIDLSFKNVVLNLAANYAVELVAGANADITMVNCEINHASPSETAYFVYAPGTALKFCISGLKTNAAIFYTDVVGTTAELLLTDINMTTTYPLIRGTKHTVLSESYGNDATAVMFGYGFRIGDVVGGAMNEVYFASSEVAFDAAEGRKVYDLRSGTAVEIQPPQPVPGDTQQTSAHVAKVSANGVIYYYENLEDAIAYARSFSGSTVTLLKSATLSASTTLGSKTITIVGANADVTLSYNGSNAMFALKNRATVIFANVKLNVTNLVSADNTSAVVLAEGVSFASKPAISTSASGIYFANEALAVFCGYTVRIDDNSFGGSYAYAKNGYRNPSTLDQTFIDSVPSESTVYVLCAVNATRMNIDDKTLTFVGVGNGAKLTSTNTGAYLFRSESNTHLTIRNLEINSGGNSFYFFGNHAESSLRLEKTHVYGVAAGSTAGMILVEITNGKFDCYIDSESSVGYTDTGSAQSMSGTRCYPVIWYNMNTNLAGDLNIHGKIYAYVYTDTSKISYVTDSNGYSPKAQSLILLGSGTDFLLEGSVTVASQAILELHVDYTGAQSGDKYPDRQVGHLVKVYGLNYFFVEDGATLTLDVKNGKGNEKYSFVTVTAKTYKTEKDGKNVSFIYGDNGVYTAYLIGKMDTTGGVTVDGKYVFVYGDDAYRASGADAATTGSHDVMNAFKLSEFVNEKYGYSTTISKVSNAKGAYKVMLGIKDDATRAKAAALGLSVNEAAIVVEGNTVMLLAWSGAALDAVTTTFMTMISETEGEFILPKNVSMKFVVDENWRDDFTKPEGDLWGGEYVNDNSIQYVYDGYSTTAEGQAAYNAYIAQLKSEGYTEVWSNTIGTNIFGLYTNANKKLSLYVAYHDYAYKEEYLLEYERQKTDPDNILLSDSHVSDDGFEHRDHHKTIRVISMPTDSVPVPNEKLLKLDMSYTKVTDTMMTMVGLTQASVGTCYVYMLEDGRFIVIDGGMGSAPIENIYKAMTSLYKQAYGKSHTESGEKLHIAAWYLTHPHLDHAQSFYRFVLAHKNELKMDYMLANIPAQNSIMTNPLIQITEDQIAEMQTAVGGFEMLRVQTGQKVYFANLEVEVLMTYEDHVPFNITTTNDVNVVTRFTIHNKNAKNGEATQILNLGDAWRHTSRFLCEMYGDHMQTEIVQIAHHGNVGCERALYEAINPRAALVANGSATFRNYLWFTGSKPDSTFTFAADVWCATNVEYMWSAPEDTYNTLTFRPARADYENVTDYVNGGKKLTESSYTTYTTHADFSKAGNYIHNLHNAYVEVNVYWGDMSVTHGADGWVADGDNIVVVENVGTTAVSFSLEYKAKSDSTGATGTFKENGTVVEQNTAIALGLSERKEYEFTFGTATPPTSAMKDEELGIITVTIK